MVLLAFSFVGFLKSLLMIVFVLTALLLMLVVLLQEPKGGGLSSAFGGAGAETFGVQTGSVNRFTAWVAGIFMASALFYAAMRPDDEALPSQAGIEEREDSLGDPTAPPPGAKDATPANNGGGTPPGDGTAPPADDGAEKDG